MVFPNRAICKSKNTGHFFAMKTEFNIIGAVDLELCDLKV